MMEISVKEYGNGEPRFRIKIRPGNREDEAPLAILGDFNNWEFDPRGVLQFRNKKKRYRKLKLRLPQGRYQFKLYNAKLNRFIEPTEPAELVGPASIERCSNHYGTLNYLLTVGDSESV